ncbi:AraC family transcriptional regulator [Amycolatopsis azurea]|uniref:AraC family transcriptional regulator n=1 Tax=Amycolatopsis azurea DSM 43854 TaxID=1238180 RepID=M2QSL6_9PSEU|nr:AraC family transcriptional regulator [Amycolatopsis azurea]EMD29516.1 Transcriptional regulator, AraC family [Amycolatopsis azurea DSM 43854]OOC02708.1 AraC family transcriptional regulator [Amycolatopsis azurea DSM 43854]
MDPLAGLLDGPRARGAFLLKSVMTPPWSLRIEDEAPLTVMAQVRGESWVVPDRGDAVRLGTGDIAIARGPDPYLVADDPATPPQAMILPGQECLTPEGKHLTELSDLGVRTWGSDPDGPVVLLTGTYPLEGEISKRLLSALPPMLVVRDDEWENPLVSLLAGEIVKDTPGQEAVLDRVLDLLLVAALRTWFDRPGAEAPAWYRAHSDPVVGRALKLLQHKPSEPWTVASLAADTGVSRAAFARRFTAAVGEPPMAYLASWRIALAADLLRQHPDVTIGAVARQVGYGSSFALSTAFKREHGVSPQGYRAGVA